MKNYQDILLALLSVSGVFFLLLYLMPLFDRFSGIWPQAAYLLAAAVTGAVIAWKLNMSKAFKSCFLMFLIIMLGLGILKIVLPASPPMIVIG